MPSQRHPVFLKHLGSSRAYQPGLVQLLCKHKYVHNPFYLMRKRQFWYLSLNARLLQCRHPAILPTCWPRSRFRRGRVLHCCFFISLIWWRIKFFLSFDAYFRFVTDSLKKKKRLREPIYTLLLTGIPIYSSASERKPSIQHIHVMVCATEPLLCTTFHPSQSPLIYKEKKNIPVTFLNITFSIMLRMK